MERYNGWTNRETWLVPSWFEVAMKDGLDHVVEDISADSREEWIRSASEALEEYFDEYVYEFFRVHPKIRTRIGADEIGIIADLLGGSVSRINWHEIAEHMADKFYTETEEENDNASKA